MTDDDPDDEDTPGPRDLFGDIPEEQLNLTEIIHHLTETLDGVDDIRRFGPHHIALVTRSDSHGQLLPPEALRFLYGQGFQLTYQSREFSPTDLLDEFPRDELHRRSAGDDPARTLLSDINQFIHNETTYVSEFKRGDALRDHYASLEDSPERGWTPRDEQT